MEFTLAELWILQNGILDTDLTRELTEPEDALLRRIQAEIVVREIEGETV